MLKQLRRSMASRLAPPLARALARSWRVETIQAPTAIDPAAGPYVLLCWHEALLPVMWWHRGRGIVALVSEARDGEYLARFAASLGYAMVRGSSTRGARRMLLGAIRTLQEGRPIGITPDGPRGPRRVLKPGALLAAGRGAATVVPVHAEARPGWRARSWDRFLVPGPFARVRVAYGVPFRVAEGDDAMTEARLRAEQELERAVRMAAWPDAGATPTA